MPSLKEIIQDPQVQTQMIRLNESNSASEGADGEIGYYRKPFDYLPRMAKRLLENPERLDIANRHVNRLLGNNEKLSYLRSGEDAIALGVGDKYVLRLGPAYNSSMNETVPPPMLPSAIHHVLEFEKLSSNVMTPNIRMTLSDRLRKTPEQSTSERSNYHFRILQDAMKAYGWVPIDFESRNFMFHEGDETETPVGMDYGSFKAGKRPLPSPIAPVTIMRGEKSYIYHPRMHDRFSPLARVKNPEERLRLIRQSIGVDAPFSYGEMGKESGIDILDLSQQSKSTEPDGSRR